MSASTPRLLFSTLVRQCKPKTHTSVRPSSAQSLQPRRNLHAGQRFRQQPFVQRYGTANEPINLPPPSNHDQSLPNPDELQRQDYVEENRSEASETNNNEPEIIEAQNSSENDQAAPEEDLEKYRDSEDSKRGGTPLDIVLQTPPPSMHRNKPPPHLAPPPYVHHFDTYSLVRDLVKGGFSEEQSITLMKSIRAGLATNLDLAREGLVSKSDVENETYLFRAACSELRTSLQMSRLAENQKQRTQRAQLQHEYDILNQKVTQDMLTLREDLKGMFNDRKMASQEEKRQLDAKIQQLNYEITVTLNSDSKSQVEGLRWVLTRRAATAIGVSAFMIIAALNYSSHVNREREESEKRQKAAREAAEKAAESEARFAAVAREQGANAEATYGEALG